MFLRGFFLFLLLISLLVETSAIPFPFVFIVGTIFFLFFQDLFTLIVLFFAGITLDSLRMGHIGLTSFVILLLPMFLQYDIWIFTIKDIKIVILLLAIVSFIYILLVRYPIDLIVYCAVFGLLFIGSIIVENRRIQRHSSL